MSEPKKHHYVPQSLLRNFTSPQGRLKVISIERDRSYTSTPVALGHTNGGHTRVRHDGTRDRVTLEQWMSALEADAAADIRSIVSGTQLTIDIDDFPSLPWLAALQHYRSRFRLGYLKRHLELSGRIPEELSDSELQTALLDVTVLPVLRAWEASKDESAGYKELYNPTANLLQALRWDVIRYERPSLVVSDAYAAQYGIAPRYQEGRQPAEKRLAMHGLGVPEHEADSFSIPVTPSVALHVHHGETRKYLSAEQVNRRTVYAARTFVAMPHDWPITPQLSGWVDDQRMLRRVLAKNA